MKIFAHLLKVGFASVLVMYLISALLNVVRAPVLSTLILSPSSGAPIGILSYLAVLPFTNVQLFLLVEVLDFCIISLAGAFLARLTVRESRELRRDILKRSLSDMADGKEQALLNLSGQIRLYVDVVERFLRQTLIPAASSFLIIIAVIFAAFFINPLMSALILFKSALLLVFSSTYSIAATRLNRQLFDASDRLMQNSVLNRSLGISIWFGGLGAFWLRNRLSECRDLSRIQLKASRLEAVYFSCIALFSGVFVILGWFVLDAGSSERTGEFLTYLFYAGSVMGPSIRLASFVPEYRQTRLAIDKIGSFQTLKMEMVRDIEPADSIAFYPSEACSIIKSPVIIKRGDRIAFIGQSGSGKTSALEALLGLQRGGMGILKLNGVEDNSLQYSISKKRIRYAGERYFFESGTVLSNTRCGIDQFRDLSERYHLFPALTSDEIKAFLDREIGVDGSPLSLGERQRLNILRILASRPRILVLDEALSGVDELAEERIIQALKESSELDILVYVGHRRRIQCLFEDSVMFSLKQES